jgi:hypothetical protein
VSGDAGEVQAACAVLEEDHRVDPAEIHQADTQDDDGDPTERVTRTCLATRLARSRAWPQTVTLGVRLVTPVSARADVEPYPPVTASG